MALTDAMLSHWMNIYYDLLLSNLSPDPCMNILYYSFSPLTLINSLPLFTEVNFSDKHVLSSLSLDLQGHFEILCLSGSFLVGDSCGTQVRTGGLNSLVSPDGRVNMWRNWRPSYCCMSYAGTCEILSIILWKFFRQIFEKECSIFVHIMFARVTNECSLLLGWI